MSALELLNEVLVADRRLLIAALLKCREQRDEARSAEILTEVNYTGESFGEELRESIKDDDAELLDILKEGK